MMSSFAAPLELVDASESFGEFYRRMQPQLLRYARGAFGVADAEEITAETMARACIAYNALDRTRNAWPWLTVVARNVACDLTRARKGRRLVDDEHLRTLPDQRNPSPDDAAVAAEESRLLARAMACLSDDQRRLLRLRLVEEMSHGDIAELLQRSETAIRQQVCRAKNRVAREYTALGGRVHGVGPVVVAAHLLRRLRTWARQGTAPMLPLVGSLVVAGSLFIVGGVSGISGVLSPAAVLPAAGVTVAAAQPTTEGAAVPPGAGARATDPAGAAATRPAPALVDAERDVGPASSRLLVPGKPFAPGARSAHRIAVRTPVGTVYVEGETANSQQSGIVCTLPGVHCS